MAVEHRLLGVGVAARLTKTQSIDQDGPAFNDDGSPKMEEILELCFIDPATGNAWVIPLNEKGVDAVRKAMGPQSGLVIANVIPHL